MRNREELSALLRGVLGSDKLYFQPPESKKLEYPCIVYRLSSIHALYSNNRPYRHYKRYNLTIMDQNPDTKIPDRIRELPMCSFDRHFTKDNLNHYVFNLYY